MENTRISEQDEAQFLEMSLQERLEDNDKAFPQLYQKFGADLMDHGVLAALVRVSDRLSPYEAVQLALNALSNAAYGVKFGLEMIHDREKLELAKYVVAILGTSPLPDETLAVGDPDLKIGGNRK